MRMYTQSDFNDDVLNAIITKTGYLPSVEECKSVAHHMEYNIRADKRFANHGHLKISTQKLQQFIFQQIYSNLHKNDIPRYTQQYRTYKQNQKNCMLTLSEKADITNIATGKKDVTDFNADYLKNIYTKYFNQVLLPKIEKISWQKKNNLQYHGLWHTEQVAMLSIDIAIQEKHNPLPILISAALHDCARKSDNHDPNHGINCKPIAQSFLQNFSDADILSFKDKCQIIEAVVFHNAANNSKCNHVLNCLQDADSMRLLWSGQQKFMPNTSTGRKMAQFSSTQQIKYLASCIEKMRALKPFLEGNTGNSLSR